MNNKSNIVFTFFGILLIFSVQGFSQKTIGEVKGTIKGIIKTEKNIHIEYANVILYSEKDSSLVNGTITNSSGEFIINDVPSGNYYLECKFLGFHKNVIPDIKLIQKQNNIDLNTIVLVPAIQSIDEVEITAERKYIEYKIDKKVINVGRDISSAGGTAVDVLENTPSIQTDIDGNVKLRGSTSFTLLIDGRPTVLSPSKELKLIPAGIIKQIEIITNPSAKYDPDGIGGIINIITKKKKSNGVNGLINVSVATQQNYSGNILLNYKTNKFKITGNLGYNDQHYMYSRHYYRETYLSDTITIIDSDFETNRFTKSLEITTGMDYYINTRDIIGISGSYRKNDRNVSKILNNYEFAAPSIYEKYFIQKQTEIFLANYYILNMYYFHKFNEEKKQELTVKSFSTFFNYGNKNGLKIDTTNSDWDIIGAYPINQQSVENNKYFRIDLKADYSQNTGENSKLETGYKFYFEEDNSNYKYETYDYDINSWNSDTLQNNFFLYKKNIHSVYGTYTNEYNKLGYKLGLRIEYYKRITDQVTINEIYIIDRFDFFPTLHLQYKFSEKHQLQTSYSRRIFRLWGTYLNPITIYLDSYTISQGNPKLDPEFADSYELNYLYNFDNSFVSSEIYYRQTNNKIEQIQTLQDDNTMLYIYKNLNKDYTLGMEFMIDLKLYKWWQVNTSTNFYKYSVYGDFIENSGELNTNTYDIRIKNTFKLKKHIKIQLRGFYSAPTITSQEKIDDYFTIGISLKKEFLDRKLKFSLSMKDIFNTSKNTSSIENANFYSFYESKRAYPLIYFQISYKVEEKKK